MTDRFFEENKYDIARHTIRKIVHEKILEIIIEDAEEKYKIIPNEENKFLLCFVKDIVSNYIAINEELNSPERKMIEDKNGDLDVMLSQFGLTTDCDKKSNKTEDFNYGFSNNFFIEKLYGVEEYYEDRNQPEIDKKYDFYTDNLVKKYGENAIYIDAIICAENCLHNSQTINEKEITILNQAKEVLTAEFGQADPSDFPDYVL